MHAYERFKIWISNAPRVSFTYVKRIRRIRDDKPDKLAVSENFNRTQPVTFIALTLAYFNYVRIKAVTFTASRTLP